MNVIGSGKGNQDSNLSISNNFIIKTREGIIRKR
jgi:hypothetical protein